MAEQVVIQELVTRLIGDATQFQRTLDEAIARVKEFGNTVTSIMATVAEAVGFRSALSGFTDFQDNLVRLETTIKANGLAVDETMSHYKAFADQMEATTRVSSVMATQLLSTAASFDLLGEKGEKAVRLAIGLSQGRPGVSPNEVIRALSMFWRTSELREGLEGEGRGGTNYGMYYLARILGLGGRGMGMGRGEGAAEGQKKMMEEINKQLEIAMQVSEKLGNTFGGQMARITNYLADLRAELGGIIAQWLQPFVDWLGKAVLWIKELDPNIKKIAVALLGLATVLTAGGPIMTFFMFLLRLATNISPITIAVMALVGITAIWIKYVGGVAAAWGIVLAKIQEVTTAGMNWLTEFITTHQRLVLAIGLAATTIITLVAAWRLLSTTLLVINGILTTLYIRQALAIAGMTAWQAAVIMARVALVSLSVVLSAAGILGGLAAMLISLTAQTAIWLAARAAILLWNMAALGAQTILIATRAALNALLAATIALKIALTVISSILYVTFYGGLKLIIGAINTAIIIFRGFQVVINAVGTSLQVIGATLYGLIFIFGTIAGAATGIYEITTKTMNAFIRATQLVDEAVATLWTSLKALGNILYSSVKAGFAALGEVASGVTKIFGSLFTAIGSISWGAYTFSVLAAAAAESIATFGLNVLIGSLVASVGAVIAATGAWGVYATVSAGVVTLMTGLWASLVAVGSALVTLSVATGAAAWTGLVAIFVSLRNTSNAFLDTLLALGRATGPVGHIGSLFQEWFSILYNAYKAAQLLPSTFEKAKEQIKELTTATTGTELAWQLLVAGAELAIEQIKALWLPLRDYIIGVWKGIINVLMTNFKVVWETIKDAGLTTWETLRAYATPTWRLIGEAAEAIWIGALDAMKGAFNEFIDYVVNAMIKGLKFAIDPRNWFLALQGVLIAWNSRTENNFHQVEKAAENTKKRLDEILGRKIVPEYGPDEKASQEQRRKDLQSYIDAAGTALDKAKEDLKSLQDNFNVADNAAIEAARNRVAELTKALNILLETQEVEGEKSQKGLDLGAPFTNATKEIKKWEAALYNSSDAYAHWFEYMDRLNEWENKKGSLSPSKAENTVVGPEGGVKPPPLPNANPAANAERGAASGLGSMSKEDLQNLMQMAVVALTTALREPLPRTLAGLKFSGLGR